LRAFWNKTERNKSGQLNRPAVMDRKYVLWAHSGQRHDGVAVLHYGVNNLAHAMSHAIESRSLSFDDFVRFALAHLGHVCSDFRCQLRKRG
jgi:hypothetical protein